MEQRIVRINKRIDVLTKKYNRMVMDRVNYIGLKTVMDMINQLELNKVRLLTT